MYHPFGLNIGIIIISVFCCCCFSSELLLSMLMLLAGVVYDVHVVDVFFSHWSRCFVVAAILNIDNASS